MSIVGVHHKRPKNRPTLLIGGCLAAAHLLSLKVLVQKEQSSLVGLGGAHDGEHALTGVVVRGLTIVSKELLSISQGFQRLTLAIEMRAPEFLRISLILLPARPMMQPTMSAGILMF